METQTLKKKQPEILYYKRNGFGLIIDNNWFIHEVNETQTFFYGPEVGNLRVGFYLTVIGKNGKSYLQAALKTKEQQQQSEQYRVLEEMDLSKENYRAYMRRSSWYDPKTNMVLFVREIFTESDDQIFILSSSIPNSPDLPELERAIVKMMNSFHFIET